MPVTESPPEPPPVPVVHAAMAFDEASALVVDYLKSVLPMGFWAVTRYDGENQLYLEVRDDAYGRVAGDSHRWEDSFCVNMVSGATPSIAPDAMAVTEYASAGVAGQIEIGSYIGIPIVRADGEVFGTLCGLDPETRTEELTTHGPLLSLLAGLLSSILEADLQRTGLERRLERAHEDAETDALTGLLNRRGWDRHLAREESRHARFGDPAAVAVIDLDDLKAVNDAEGHEAGDRHLRAAADAIMSAIRPTDVVARIGGDEFGVLLTNVGPADAMEAIERILAAFDEAGVAASVGHAPYTVIAGFPGAFEVADARMYEQKRHRRDRRA